MLGARTRPRVLWRTERRVELAWVFSIWTITNNLCFNQCFFFLKLLVSIWINYKLKNCITFQCRRWINPTLLMWSITTPWLTATLRTEHYKLRWNLQQQRGCLINFTWIQVLKLNKIWTFGQSKIVVRQHNIPDSPNHDNRFTYTHIITYCM